MTCQMENASSLFFFSTEHHEPKKVPFCEAFHADKLSVEANGDKKERESIWHFERVLREF